MHMCKPISTFAIVLFPLLAACGSFGSSVDGRYVQGKVLFHGAMESNGHEATVYLGSKEVHVTKDQLTWMPAGSLQLPGQWNNLQLAEGFSSVTVYVDGQWYAKIQP
jgi:hypothetical protein